MKPIVIYTAGFLISFALTFGLMFALAKISPGAFSLVSLVSGALQEQPHRISDSTGVHSTAEIPTRGAGSRFAGLAGSVADSTSIKSSDTIHVVPGTQPRDTTTIKLSTPPGETDIVKALQDSIKLLLTQLEMQKQKFQTVNARLESVLAQKDTIGGQRKKNLSKIYEAMSPEDAAKILQNLTDSEVVEILLSMQKRQAAKVLSLLDPSRAAKIYAQIN